jgi:uncharacterized membrane protein YjgN (DUF898 family)
MDISAGAEGARPGRMRFAGELGDLFGILLRGSLLQIPTFGFYRFWLITDVRRHLWANTHIGDDALEYTGRARELLIGFLIALAVLVPIYLVYFVLAAEAERLVAFASVPLFLILYVLGQFALYRARRYRVTRTILRGVRFWMTGSGWAYAGRVALWDLLTVLTLGLLYPWRVAALERYKMRNTHFGNLQGDFLGRGATFFRRAGWIWGIYLLLVALIALLAVESFRLTAGLLLVPAAIAALLLLPVFLAIQLRWWLEGVRLGPVAVETTLRTGTVYWCYAKTILIALAYAGVGGIVISVFFAILMGLAFSLGLFEGMTMSAGTPPPVHYMVAGTVVGGLVYLAFALGFDIIRRLFLDRGIWAVSADSVTLTNREALDSAIAAGGEVPGGVGEGLLDALDFGGGV